MHYTVKVSKDIWTMGNKVQRDSFEGSTQNVSLMAQVQTLILESHKFDQKLLVKASKKHDGLNDSEIIRGKGK